MPKPIDETPEIALPDSFRFGQVDPLAPHATRFALTEPKEPPLGPLANFVGKWAGYGFNTIFRPNNAITPTQLPAGPAVGDNVLELNLTTEVLAFSQDLGSVPNRGTQPQGDIFLNGVPYLQTVNDVTTPGQSIGIHVEPGLWMAVPATTNPLIGPTLTRMASIPHGTTICAQGTSIDIAGPPTIPVVNITPFSIGTTTLIPFPSQTAATPGTPRIPQDLTAFIAAGTITQALLDDPNSLLRNHIAQQKITATTAIVVATDPPPWPAMFGGGTGNIAFLDGTPAAAAAPNTANSQNAQALRMSSTFWIETVEHTVTLPIWKPGDQPITVALEDKALRRAGPTLVLIPPFPISKPRDITFTTTQIQYSQLVILNFNTLSWPHVSVATLAPAEPITVPATAFGSP